MDPISGMMTYSSFYVTTFPNRPLLGVPSYSVGGGVTDSRRTSTYIMDSRLTVSLGRVADWDRNHPGEGAYGR